MVGTFVRSNSPSNASMCQVLNNVNHLDWSTDSANQRKLKDSTDAKACLLRVREHLSVSGMPVEFPPLRQRHVEDRMECVQTNNVLVRNNDLLVKICFVYQAEDVLSGQCSSFGISNVCAV